jgi:hypothetical protein
MAEEREVKQARAKVREREGAYWGRVAEAGKAARQGRGEAEAEAERATAGKGGDEGEERKRAGRQRQALSG